VLRESAASDPFRVVILDMQLPGLSGDEPAKIVRANPDLGIVSLILLSPAGVLPGGSRAARVMGFDALVTKPIHQSALLDAIVAVLGDSRHVPEATCAGVVAPSPNAVSGLNVLLAEDNGVNRMVALRMLKRLGCRVDDAIDGSEAVAAVTCGSYDIVLMDVQMPVMDGLEATAEIRRLERNGYRIPIIAMTADAMEGDRERCLEAGMDDYISKPVGRGPLAEALARWARYPARLDVQQDSGETEDASVPPRAVSAAG
jgi:CheY-like chemotaxis protein